MLTEISAVSTAATASRRKSANPSRRRAHSVDLVRLQMWMVNESVHRGVVLSSALSGLVGATARDAE